LAVIEQLHSITAVHAIPGHGPVTADWHVAPDNESRYLVTLLEDVRTAIKQGKSMEQTIDESTQSEQAYGRVLFDIVIRRNISLVLPGLEWE